VGFGRWRRPKPHQDTFDHTKGTFSYETRLMQ
jgi:hypothetical protein